MAKTISYCVTVCNELEEITELLNFLQTHITENDEILIQYDETGVTPEVLEYLKLMDKMHENHIVVGFPLNKDFATFKNNLTKIATKEFIFQIDADELPNPFLVENLGTVLETNNVDLILIPRVNIVNGLTIDHIKKWGWKVNEEGWVNWPDYQTRIYRRTDDIEWRGDVHERITGYSTISNFPSSPEWSLLHVKTIEKQEQQVALYETIDPNVKEH
jgi:glycosyltransferase involved in cell wall biosynthesis